MWWFSSRLFSALLDPIFPRQKDNLPVKLDFYLGVNIDISNRNESVCACAVFIWCHRDLTDIGSHVLYFAVLCISMFTLLDLFFMSNMAPARYSRLPRRSLGCKNIYRISLNQYFLQIYTRILEIFIKWQIKGGKHHFRCIYFSFSVLKYTTRKIKETFLCFYFIILPRIVLVLHKL